MFMSKAPVYLVLHVFCGTVSIESLYMRESRFYLVRNSAAAASILWHCEHYRSGDVHW